jgi:uncharacterized RDD family membrane protein YckC
LTPGIIILLNAILSFRDINGQGIGKRIMKIKVISMRHEDGKLRLNQYIIRYITLFALPAEFWFYWGTQGKERWGDKLAGTKVINVQ